MGDLKEGLKRTVKWYNAQGQTFAPVEFAEVEVLAKMPPSWVREDLRESAMVTGSRINIEAMDSSLEFKSGYDLPIGDTGKTRVILSITQDNVAYYLILIV